MVLLACLQDDEGREVAIKIDRLDAKKFTAEIATKSYVEVSYTWTHNFCLFV